MSEKKTLTEEELENVSGGACNKSPEPKKCIKCKSTNLYWSDCGYNIMKFICNNCGKSWNESNNGIEELN